MDSMTKTIRAEILRQYKSVRQFSEKSGIPYSTLSNALTKGIGGTSYDTVNKICKLLGLKQAYDADLTVLSDQYYELFSMLSALDEQALHTLKTVLTIEYQRCTYTAPADGKPYGGLYVTGRDAEQPPKPEQLQEAYEA